MKKIIASSIIFACSLLSYGQTIQITWDANPEPDISGYRLHYSTNSLIPPFSFTNTVGSTTLTSTIPVVSGPLYAITATAFNTSGLESDYSQQLRYQLFRSYTKITNNLVLLGSSNWPTAILRRSPTNGILSGAPPNLQYRVTNTIIGISRDYFIYEISDSGVASTNYYSIHFIVPNSPPRIRPIIDTPNF